MNLTPARNCRSRDGWRLVTLNEEEVAQAYAAVRQKNNEIFQQCLDDALKALHKYRPWHNNVALALPVAQQLFKRQAVHVHTVFDAAIKRKAHDLKNGEAR